MKYYLASSRIIGLIGVALAFVIIAKSESWAGGATPEEIQRFEELSSVSALSCDIWEKQYQIDFKANDQGLPSLLPAEDKMSRTQFVMLLNENRDGALQFSPDDDDFDGSLAWANSITLRPPVNAFLGPDDFGVLASPHPISLGLFRFPLCMNSLTDCRPLFEILADPEHKSFFPLFSTYREEDRISIFLGRCYPEISDEFRKNLPEVHKLISDERIREEAFCDTTDWPFSGLIATSLLLTQPSGESLIELYSFLRIISNLPDDSEAQAAFARVFNIALDITAERMTPDQIEIAERQAAEWKPDPSKCEETTHDIQKK
jgi:hypothetical protein